MEDKSFDLVKMYEKSTKKIIRECYKSIDFLNWELDYLNRSLKEYEKRRPDDPGFLKKFKYIYQIRERIPLIYDDIKYHKECINAEKSEMRRIYDTYGYVPYYEDEYEDDYKANNNFYDYKYYHNDNDDDNDSDYDDDDTQINCDELEEIKDYKFNPITGLFE
jgi:hypothetical protein